MSILFHFGILLQTQWPVGQKRALFADALWPDHSHEIIYNLTATQTNKKVRQCSQNLEKRGTTRDIGQFK